MNIVEALKTKLDFKREKDLDWVDRDIKSILLSRVDLFAEDWVVKPDLESKRLLAYIATTSAHQRGQVFYDYEGEKVNMAYYIRAPWLDEPQSNQKEGE